MPRWSRRSGINRREPLRQDRGLTTTRRHVALIRGINVGKAKRVAMSDLRALVEDLGYRDVRTLLNSGNVVFAAPASLRKDPAARIEKAITERLGISARVTVLTAAELADAVSRDPFGKVPDDHSRLFVTVLIDPAHRKRLLPLARQDWATALAMYQQDFCTVPFSLAGLPPITKIDRPSRPSPADRSARWGLPTCLGRARHRSADCPCRS